MGHGPPSCHALRSEDTLNTTHPMSSSTRLKALADVDNYFDAISYEKVGLSSHALAPATA